MVRGEGCPHADGEAAEPGADHGGSHKDHAGLGEIALVVQSLDQHEHDGHDGGHPHELAEDGGEEADQKQHHDLIFALHDGHLLPDAGGQADPGDPDPGGARDLQPEASRQDRSPGGPVPLPGGGTAGCHLPGDEPPLSGRGDCPGGGPLRGHPEGGARRGGGLEFRGGGGERPGSEDDPHPPGGDRALRPGLPQAGGVRGAGM